MRRPMVLALAVLLGGCVTTPQGPRTPEPVPEPPEAGLWGDFPSPTPSWPLRSGPHSPELAIAPPSTAWAIPTTPTASAPGPDLPLPGVLALPEKQPPVPRPLAVVSQAKPAVLPVPSPPAKTVPAGVASKTSPATTAAPKPPAAVPVAPAPVPALPASAPKTQASTASLLPADKTVGQDFRWEDVNAMAGDAVTLHFDKANWLYLDPPAQQKTLGFQSISREKDATTFQFRPLAAGQYTLEFQRQDLVNQSTDRRKIRLTVVTPGTRTAKTGTDLAPQTSTTAPDDALETSRKLAASGKTSEAVQKLLQNYRSEDTRTNLELARLLDQDGHDDEALTYLEKNLSVRGPETQGSLELGTRLSALKDPQKRLPGYLNLWTAGSLAPPEDLYILVLGTLRTEKLGTAARDWANRYGAWFPAPNLRDQYLFQLGQLLEEPGDGRDIKGAWKAYNELVQNYPLSPDWKAAGERAAYLNRHFLQVR